MPDNAHIVIQSSSTSPTSRAFPPRSQSMYLERGISGGSGGVGRQDSYDGQYSDHEDGSYHQTVNYSDYEPQISRLKMRKDELERQEREGRRMRRQLAVATAEHVSTTLEICPRFVVPDTNCFIDHLADLRQIAITGLFGEH